MKLRMLGVLSLLLCALPHISHAATNRKLVIIAGTYSDHGPGAHMFPQCGEWFKQQLDAEGLPWTIVLATNDWPTDVSVFNDADAIVLYSNGDASHPFIASNRFYTMQLAMNRGASFGILHYALDLPYTNGGNLIQQWCGGFYDDNQSTNPVWTGYFNSFPSHPITVGVSPYNIGDEFYYNINFKTNAPVPTPILQAVVPSGFYLEGSLQTVAWAITQTNGARGFADCGGHWMGDWTDWNSPQFTNNWRILENAFKWLSKLDVTDSFQYVFRPGTNWSYLASGSAPAAGWTNASFNEAGWSSGSGSLGYDTAGADPITTTISYGGVSTNKYITTYFRKTFVLNGNATNATLTINADDGAVVYVNGNEAGRTRMATGAVAYSTLASQQAATSTDETQWVSFSIPSAWLQTGTNAVAVEVHQATANSSDLRFDAYMTLDITPPTEQLTNGIPWRYLDNGSDQGSAWYASSFPSETNWLVGPSAFGYGGNTSLIATTTSYGPSSTNKYVTTYFRRPIVLSDTNLLSSPVTFYAQIDDGAIVYVNGSPVTYQYMTNSGVTYQTLATIQNGNPVTNIYTFTVPSSAFVNGTNILAVELHQGGVGSSDTYFNLWASGLVSYASIPTITSGGGVTNPAPTNTAPWTAYNDCAWHQDATLFGGAGIEPAVGNYTTNSPWGNVTGTLINTNGQALTAQVSFSGTVGMLARDFSLPAGSDVESVFAGHVGTNNAVNWTFGTVQMTLSSLNTSKQYTVAIWSSRGGTTAAYSNRWTDITITSVDSFANNSSAGLTKLTSVMANDETRVVAVIEGGKLARYDQIRPGTDGTIVFTLTANGLTGTTETNGYLNAIMVSESEVATNSSGDTDTDGMPDSWEQTYFGGTSATNGGVYQDADGDGVLNIEEFIAGSNPSLSSSGPMLDHTVLTNGLVQFDMPTATGRLYFIDFMSNMTSSSWQPYTNFTGNGGTMTITNTRLDPRLYYRFRIRMENP